MTDQLLVRVQNGYRKGLALTAAKIPYVFGGGHNTLFDVSKGADCSGLASAILKVEGMLQSPPATWPYDTEEFETWGEPGVGKWQTLYVIDSGTPAPDGQHHCFFMYQPAFLSTLPDTMPKYTVMQAAHEGTDIGFLDPNGKPWVMPTTGYNARHWSGT